MLLKGLSEYDFYYIKINLAQVPFYILSAPAGILPRPLHTCPSSLTLC